ncbi:unnamed protein product, partial [Iphiclides podalirius]
MVRTARCVSGAVKKLMSPEEDDEEAEYDRADDMVTEAWLGRRPLRHRGHDPHVGALPEAFEELCTMLCE